MQVFKTFMKILKTRLTSAILYLVIFMVIAVIMADTAKDNNDYEDYKMSISVIDRDNSAESKRLQDFIFSGNKKVELADDDFLRISKCPPATADSFLKAGLTAIFQA